jgi:hypothetical protein
MYFGILWVPIKRKFLSKVGFSNLCFKSNLLRFLASNADEGDLFGQSVALSSSGDLLLVGANGESSISSGLNGDEQNNDRGLSGAAYLFDSFVFSFCPVGAGLNCSCAGNVCTIVAPEIVIDQPLVIPAGTILNLVGNVTFSASSNITITGTGGVTSVTISGSVTVSGNLVIETGASSSQTFQVVETSGGTVSGEFTGVSVVSTNPCTSASVEGTSYGSTTISVTVEVVDTCNTQTLSTGAIIGIAVGGAVVVVLVFLIVLCVILQRREAAKRKQLQKLKANGSGSLVGGTEDVPMV